MILEPKAFEADLSHLGDNLERAEDSVGRPGRRGRLHARSNRRAGEGRP